jgi:hypothetical protein
MKQTGEFTAWILAGLLCYPQQFCSHKFSVSVHSSCLLVHDCCDVAPFPPAELPAFIGTIAPSDSLLPVSLSPFIISCQAYSLPCKRPQGLPRCHIFAMSDMPCSPTPGKRIQTRHFVVCPVSISDRSKASSFPLVLSRLNHFNLAAYGLSARCPTLNLRGHPLRSKDSLLGGWLVLPRRDSHPLEYATLPGRTERLPFNYFGNSSPRPKRGR